MISDPAGNQVDLKPREDDRESLPVMSPYSISLVQLRTETG